MKNKLFDDFVKQQMLHIDGEVSDDVWNKISAKKGKFVLTISSTLVLKARLIFRFPALFLEKKSGSKSFKKMPC